MMIMRRTLIAALLAGLTFAPPAALAQNVSADAKVAAQSLRNAADKLDAALSAQDQVVALTDMIRAYEEGMAALRQGLRQAGMREAEIRHGFEARRETLSHTLSAMAVLQRSPETALLLHPSGPEATARASIVLADIAPALRAEADEMQRSLEEIALVRQTEQEAANIVAQGLGQVQEARRLLASVMADRSDLPTRFLENPSELDALLTSAKTLEAFAEGVAGLESDVGAPFSDFEGAAGALPMPVAGTVLRGYRQPDAAGVSRPGLVIVTGAAALVTSPWQATIRYRGPLLNYDNVMIIEPSKNYLIVFAGLDKVFGEVGDVIPAGEPLGLMAGSELPAAEFGADFVLSAAAGRDASQSQTLYIELRKGKQTLDPAEWFAPNPIILDPGPDSD